MFIHLNRRPWSEITTVLIHLCNLLHAERSIVQNKCDLYGVLYFTLSNLSSHHKGPHTWWWVSDMYPAPDILSAAVTGTDVTVSPVIPCNSSTFFSLHYTLDTLNNYAMLCYEIPQSSLLSVYSDCLQEPKHRIL